LTRDDDVVAGHLLGRGDAPPGGDPGPCPDDNRLAAFLDGRVAAPERAALERHLAACDACREVLAEALALREPGAETVPVAGERGGGTSPGGPRSGPARREPASAEQGGPLRGWWIAWAAAAAVLLGVGAWLLQRTGPSTPPPDVEQLVAQAAADLSTAHPALFGTFHPLTAAERAEAAPTRLRGAGAVLRPAGYVLPERPTIEWEAFTGATGYEVILSLENGTVLWRRTVGGVTTLPYPADAAALAHGGRYLVRIESRGPLGRTDVSGRFAVGSDVDRKQLAEALRLLEGVTPPEVRRALEAEVALRRNFLLEAERLLEERVAAAPDDAFARELLRYTRRRIGLPE
jgi:hypothetical protein